MTPPVLHTERLTLSAHTMADFEDVAALWADKQVVRYIGQMTRDRQDSWFTHLRNRGLWDMLGYGYWVIREKDRGVFVGEIGFADFKRGMEPNLSGSPEAGWVIASSAWGKGYATEAGLAAHSWLDETIPGRSNCIIEPDHAASIRLAEKFGYRELCHSAYRGVPVIVFERETPHL